MIRKTDLDYLAVFLLLLCCLLAELGIREVTVLLVILVIDLCYILKLFHFFLCRQADIRKR